MASSGWSIGTRYRVQHVVDRKWLFLGIYAALMVILVLLFVRLPTGFLPTEDQGFAQIQFNLPGGATINRTQAAQKQIEDYFLKTEGKNTVRDAVGRRCSRRRRRRWPERGSRFRRARRRGMIVTGSRQHTPTPSPAAPPVRFSGLRDVEFYATVPAAVRGLGQSSGFTIELQNTGGLSRVPSSAPPAKNCSPRRGATPIWPTSGISDLPDQPTLKVDMDAQKLSVLGLNQSRRQYDAVDRLGWALRQRFQRPWAREASLCPG